METIICYTCGAIVTLRNCSRDHEYAVYCPYCGSTDIGARNLEDGDGEEESL
jgi:hypothetical protein